MTDWASYAARWRSRGDYRVAAIIEQHMGERRSFDDQGNHLVARCGWSIPDARQCRDFSRQDLEAYGAGPWPELFAAMHAARRQARWAAMIADAEYRSNWERRLDDYTRRAA